MESEDGLEDGEIVDYTPLERPIEMMQKDGESTHRPAPLQLSSEEEESPSTSDSSDSERERRRSTKKRKMSKHFSKFSKNKPMNKYDIWSVGLQEESLAENLSSFNVVKTDQSRSVESYNYKLKYELEDDENPLKQQLGRHDDDNREFRTNKRRHGERGNVKMRLGRRDFSPEQKGSSRVLIDLSVTSESTEDEVSKDITEKLSEKKDDLIYRVVTGVGKEKAIQLFNETKRIEEDGGMMVMNGSRRRTPGGVFLSLLKRDDDIPAEKIREIFVDDKINDQQTKKHNKKHWRNRTTKELKQTLIADGLLPPALLTRAELELRNGGESSETAEGEGERAVTNPPPSPATDCDQTEVQATPNVNSLVTYDDDFLELNADDDMEVF